MTETHQNEYAGFSSEMVPEFRDVVVHRSMIRYDIINLFKNPTILNNCILNVTIINANGQIEKGEGDGVLRDILTHFWHECFTTICIGGTEKTSFLLCSLSTRNGKFKVH